MDSVQKRLDKIVNSLNTTETGIHMSEKGGEHLASVRSWIQSKCLNGETVQWGSQDFLKMPHHLTVQDLEMLACTIAASAVNDYKNQLKISGLVKFLKEGN